MNDHLMWRYATKKFDASKKIPKAELQELLETLQFSPSSCGLQPWKFIVIHDADLRKKLKAHGHDQSQITDADTLIVFCAVKNMDESYVKRFIERVAQVRHTSKESLAGYEQMMITLIKGKGPQDLSQWTHNQVYIALGMLLNECAYRRIDACPMEGFDAQKFNEILELPKAGLEAVVLCTIGYRAADDKYAAASKVRFEQNEVFIERS